MPNGTHGLLIGRPDVVGFGHWALGVVLRHDCDVSEGRGRGLRRR
jgi:hypothetical protein